MSTSVTVDGAALAAAPTARAAVGEAGSSIGFEQVTVAYRGTVVLEDFTLGIEPGEIMALLGPSGCGKTTALRALAGFVRPVRGKVSIGDQDVTALPPYARDIGMVVQNYALFPHMSVGENVAFGLRARSAPAPLIAERVPHCLAMVGMAQYADRYPRQLSGGQQQRVAIARALAIRPRVLLLDEPLSALDAQIRRAMVEELARLHRELPNLTVLYVTHDQTEALTLADRIAIMRDGKLSACGYTRNLYLRPPNRFTAEFLGRANVIPVEVEAFDGVRSSARARVGGDVVHAATTADLPAGPALLCVRPHDLKLEPAPERNNAISGTVEQVHWQGETQTVTFTSGGTSIRLVSTPLRHPPEQGAPITVHFATEDAVLIPDDGKGHG